MISSMRPPRSDMADSPVTTGPPSSLADRRMSLTVDGRMRPWTASTLLDSYSASSKLPVTSVMAVMNRLPKLWPSRPSPWSKRCWNSLPTSDSSSAIATRQFLKSPGGSTPSSLRSLPELPPSSATVTMADMLSLCVFSPRNRTERPVPPPMAAILGPRRRDRRAYSVSARPSMLAGAKRTGRSVR